MVAQLHGRPEISLAAPEELEKQMNKPNSSAIARMQALAKRVDPPKVTSGRELEIPLNKIVFDKDQPRSDFHHTDGQVAQAAQMTLEELAESIKANDLISPITVEALDDGTYRVLVGERRTRAHLMIGKTTIRAIVNDTLAKGDRKKRLLFQLAENVNRDDLSEADMARNIRFLMQGHEDSPALTQTQIAKDLGKSEGWVSRYVRFGDAELQRLWVESGIADTVENLYRISVLPTPVQVDIQRRVALNESDPEFLPRPLPRSVIDKLAKDAKLAKKGGATPAASSVTIATSVSSTESETKDHDSAKDTPTGSRSLQDTPRDEVAETFAQMAKEGQQSPENVPATSPASVKSDSGQGYTLSPDVRKDILSKAQVAVSSSMTAQPPVSVRVSMAGLQKLLARLGEEEVQDFNSVPLALTLPGPLAQRIANTLAGVIVDPSEVPAVVQNQIIKL